MDQFKYLGCTQTKDGTSVNEVKIRLWQTKPSVSPQRLYCISRLSCQCFSMGGYESWTLTADLESRIQAFENKCYRRMLRISYRAHKTNEKVWEQVSILAGPQELLLSTVKRRKLSWFGRLGRHDTLPKFMLQGTVDGRRHRGRPRKS